MFVVWGRPVLSTSCDLCTCSLKLLHQSLGGDAFTRKHIKIVAQYPLHHVTCAPAKFEGFRLRCIYKKVHNLTFDLDLEVNVTQNVAQYPLRHVIYASAKFKVVRSNVRVRRRYNYKKCYGQCHQTRSILVLALLNNFMLLNTPTPIFIYFYQQLYSCKHLFSISEWKPVWTMITCRQCVGHLLGVQEAVLEHCTYLQTRRLHVNTIVKEVATELPPLLFHTLQQPEVNIFPVINVLNQFTEVSYDSWTDFLQPVKPQISLRIRAL